MICKNFKMRTNFAIQDSKNIKSATNRIRKILDSKLKRNTKSANGEILKEI